MATPTICIVNPDAPANRQQAVMVATKEARSYSDKKRVHPKPPLELLNQTTALSHAEKLLQAEGIAAPSRQMCLGKLVVPFGLYENAPFHWLVANDVGYMKYIVDKHRAEVTNPRRTGEIAHQWVKDLLTEYADSFPQVSTLLEANVDRCIYGQRGFEDHTFQEMWELYRKYPIQQDRPEQFSSEQREIIQKAYSSVRMWLHTPVAHIPSVQMKRFRKYINNKDQQPQASTSSSWPGDDTEQVAASQFVEYSLKSQVTAQPEKSEAAVQPTDSPSTSQSHDYPMQPHLKDSPVELEGWVHLWENPSGIPSADISWLKEDTERGLFTSIQKYMDNTGLLKRRRVMKSDRMWFYPPEPPGYVRGGVPTPQLFFRSRVFVWHPVGVWRYSLKCPRGDKCVGFGQNVHLYKSGYHHRVRHICDVSSWYTLLTEVLCCGPCTKAARSGQGGTEGRWLAWDANIVSQLSEAHQSMFPAVFTSERGVDKNVVRLLRDRTGRNTMVKVWRKIQENHVEEYLQRKDLYTTLLMTVVKPGGIVSALRQTFQPPPPPRELPSAQLLRHAFLIAEANNVQHYRSQILSTFGTVLKMDSTKKVVKKLSGEDARSAEWFTSIGNEHSQIVSFVLTCEESTEKLKPMCHGVMERFRLANQPVPKILYVDCGCCSAQGQTALEILFQPWVDNGMVVRLDIFHWIHRFDAAICTESHSKYAAFKSAVAGAVLAYNRMDLKLLIKAVRAKDLETLKTVSDEDIVHNYISREQLKHHVRRITLGAQETLRLIQQAIEELKGPAGLDENGVSLFKTPEAIDEVWSEQQRHLECIQDPPDMSMYRVAHTTTINNVHVPYYKCLRGSNSVDGFHKELPNMIPGPHCAARPYQVYLMRGIARWNSDRYSDAVFGGKGRHHSSYSAPLIDRLNTRCRQLFGETVEENFRAPADVHSDELLGLEYLFRQSTGESFSVQGIVDDGPSPDEEVVQPGQPDPHEADEAYQSGEETHDDVLDAHLPHIKLTSDHTSTVHPPAFEDACSPNPLPGFQKLEKFCSVLVEIGLTEDKLSLTTEQRNMVLEAWNGVEAHDKQPQKFNQLYRTHWGNTLYCRTKRDDLVDVAVMEKVKMAKQFSQQDISPENNRLVYTLLKMLWLHLPQESHSSHEKSTILKAYEQIQQQLLVEDPVLFKACIPLPKINMKTVRDFILRQERLRNLHATKEPLIITKTPSISSEVLPPAPHQPTVLPPPDYRLQQYVQPSLAGTKVLEGRADVMTFFCPQPPLSLVLLQPVILPPPVRKAPATSTITTPVPASTVSSEIACLPASDPPPVSISPATQTLQTTLSKDSPPLWARATQYKRKLKEESSEVGAKLSRVQNLPLCKLCNQATQGHKKYKSKSFCTVKMMSSSRGLNNRVFSSYVHFTSFVDSLKK